MHFSLHPAYYVRILGTCKLLALRRDILITSHHSHIQGFKGFMEIKLFTENSVWVKMDIGMVATMRRVQGSGGERDTCLPCNSSAVNWEGGRGRDRSKVLTCVMGSNKRLLSRTARQIQKLFLQFLVLLQFLSWRSLGPPLPQAGRQQSHSVQHNVAY